MEYHTDWEVSIYVFRSTHTNTHTGMNVTIKGIRHNEFERQQSKTLSKQRKR